MTALQKYLNNLNSGSNKNAPIRVDADGQAIGSYFQSSLTSAFQTLRSSHDLQIVGYQGLARSYSPSQATSEGLSLWRLLDHSASDDESVALDRLCRLLHAINFYRQPQSFGQDLYLNVHSRLLAAIQNNHGAAFRRILDSLELPHQHIVLELPPSTAKQRWLQHHVSDNYRRNGFRIAVNALSVEQAIEQVLHHAISAIKIDAGTCQDFGALSRLVAAAADQHITVIIKKLESEAQYRSISQLARDSHNEIYLQGFLFDIPSASLFVQPSKLKQGEGCCSCSRNQI